MKPTILPTILYSLVTFIAPAFSSPLLPSTTNPNTSSITSALPNTPRYWCTDSEEWLTNRFSPRDCNKAILNLVDSTVFPEAARKFEFMGPNAPPVTSLPKQQTPLRWSYASCTVAIAMMRSFSPEGLPGQNPRKKWAQTDDGSFGDVLFGARDVQEGCLSPFLGQQTGNNRTGTAGKENFATAVGYATVGERRGIGVFLWDTNSMMNRKLFPPSVRARNGSMGADVDGCKGATTLFGDNPLLVSPPRKSSLTGTE